MGHANSPRWSLQAPGYIGDNNGYNEIPIGAGSGNSVSTLSYRTCGQSVAPFLCYEDHSGESPSKTYYCDLLGTPEYTIVTPGSYYGGNYHRMTSSIRRLVNIGGIEYQAVTNFIYLVDGSDSNATMTSIHLRQLNGFQGNESACSIDYDADTNETIVTTYVDRANNMISTVSNMPMTSVLMATNIVQNGLTIQSSTFSVPSPTLYFYDALGRTNRIQDPLGFSASLTYDPNTGWITSSTDQAGNVTSYVYYGTNEANSGKLKCQTGPSGKNTYYAYTLCGQLFQNWGDVPYPAEYVYSEYGDLTNLITFRGGSNWTGSTWPSNPGIGDNTYWVYDDASGALLHKMDAHGYATTYTYDPVTGKLLNRSFARLVGGSPVTLINYYDGYGETVERDYSDGTPSVLFNNYNRAGQPREIVDESGVNELTYDYASRLVSVTGASGIYAGIIVSNHFNPVYGRAAMICSNLSSTLETDYGYDAYGRMNAVSNGASSVGYGYLPNSDLLQTTIFSNSSSAVLTTARQWDYGFRLGSIANVVNGATVTSHDYTYDNLSRRTRATLEDGLLWNYSYNDRNELTGAGRFWPDWTPVTGQQYGYGFDNIGNRTSAQAGSVGNMSTVSYAVNGLNEYTNILTPGAKDILGLAIATNAVTVNGGRADRKGEFFHRAIMVANSGGPVWQEVTNSAGTSTVTGGLVFPANSQSLVYDADGNLTSDGIWTYEWDAENRLISMSMNNIYGIEYSNVLQVTFAYDYMNRRISKTVWTNSGSGFVPQSTNYFLYDGWNLIALFTPANAVQQSFVWGLDLSGTMAKAGGVGGLLAMASSGTNYFASYDGNGNITGLINGTDKSTSARYEYSPFGELIRTTGPMAKVNPFRFSTKFCDDEDGLVYYDYRYYNPVQGRWLNRNPLGQKGGMNLFVFVHNHPIAIIDRNGKEDWVDTAAGLVYDWIDTARGVFMPNESELSEYLTDTVGAFLTDQLADITVRPVGFDMMQIEEASELQEGAFMRNAQNMIVNRLQTQTANDTFTGLVVGMAARQLNAAGGNGDSLSLDAALQAAGTTGVDSAETIWSVATDVSE